MITKESAESAGAMANAMHRTGAWRPRRGAADAAAPGTSAGHLGGRSGSAYASRALEGREGEMRSYARVVGSASVAMLISGVVVAQQPGHQKPGSGTPCVPVPPSRVSASPLDSELCCGAAFRCQLRSAPRRGNAPRSTLVL